MFKKRTRTANLRVKEDLSVPPKVTAAAAAAPDSKETTTGDIIEDVVEEDEGESSTRTIQEILLLRKLAKQQQSAGIDLVRLNKGEDKKKKKKKKTTTTTGARTGTGTKQVKDGEGEGVDDDDEDDEEEEQEYGLRKSRAGKGGDAVGDDTTEDDQLSKAKRLVRSNNFTQQTNALDVDKHMMAYIETELAKRRNPHGSSSTSQPPDPSTSTSSQTYDDPQEQLYAIAEKYRIEKKQESGPGGPGRARVDDDDEGGNVTTSLGMLTSIPEVDLGMDVRLKNIEETERAKRAMMENRANAGRRTKRNEADESFAAARFYRPYHTVQSDAEALEDAKRQVAGLPPIQRGHQRERNETATDDQVYERFKKRVRKN